MNQEEVRQAIAEGIGTFMLILVGAGAVALNPGNLTVAALAHGLILVAIISTYGHISGAHVNPAVTLGIMLGGKIPFRQAGIYWVSQLIGALLAALILRVILPSQLPAVETLGQTAPATNVTIGMLVVTEAILTFFLVGTVFQVAVYEKGGIATPLLLGFTLAGVILLGGPLTGASLNPARTLAPGLLAETRQPLDEMLYYLVGTLGGGALAGLMHMDLFAAPEPSTSKGRKKR